MDIDLEYYKMFYYVAKHRSISKGAKELHISQPAVSQGMKHLEQQLGSRLFSRNAKGVSLTPEGDMLYSYVKQGYEAIRTGEEKLKKMISLDEGEIRIGASDMTLQYYLLPFLEEFHQQYPGIKVTVTNAPTPRTLEHLRAGRIEFGIISTPFQADQYMKVSFAREIEDIFVAGSKFWEYKNKMMHYKELEALPIICLEDDTSTRKYIDEYLLKNQVVLQPEFELATSDMIVQFATRNLGIGCVVADFAKRGIEEGELFALQFDKKIPKREICVVNDMRIPMSAAATKLLETLR